MIDMTSLGLGPLPGRLVPLPTDIVVRQSTIGSAQLCPGRVGYALEDGYDPTPSLAMVRGTLGHSVIETFLVGVREGRWTEWPLDLLPIGIKPLIAQVAEEDGWDLHAVASPDHIDQLAEEAAMLGRAWYEQLWLPHLHQLNIVAIEKRVVRPLGCLPDGRCIWVQGTPDLVTAGRIIDWKTGDRPWKENGEDLSKGSFLPQAPIYLWLAELDLGELLTDFTFYVGSLQGGVEWTEYSTSWSAQQVEAALLNAWEVGKMIAYQAFHHTPYQSTFGKFQRGWWCSPLYCGAWNVCKGKRMLADGIDTEEVRTSEWQ